MLVATAAALVATETVARGHEGTTVFPWDEPGRGFATEPNTRGANNAGFHERELPASRDPSVRRVAVVGDSMTWGTGTAEETWTRAAEHDLGSAWQVLNFGHYGYDTSQAAATMRHRVWAYEPDVVVYAAYGNDLVPTRLITVGEPPLHAWVAATGGILPPWARRASAVARKVEGVVMARAVDDVEDEGAFEAGVADMAAQAAAHGVPLIVYGLVPHILASPRLDGCIRTDGTSGRCVEALAQTRRQAEIVRGMGLVWASALPYLRGSGEESFFPADPGDWQHPSPAGDRYIGAGMADVLLRHQGGTPLLDVDDEPVPLRP